MSGIRLHLGVLGQKLIIGDPQYESSDVNLTEVGPLLPNESWEVVVRVPGELVYVVVHGLEVRQKPVKEDPEMRHYVERRIDLDPMSPGCPALLNIVGTDKWRKGSWARSIIENMSSPHAVGPDFGALLQMEEGTYGISTSCNPAGLIREIKIERLV